MKRKTFAAKVFAALIATGITAPAYAGSPVIDMTSIITSIENAAQQAAATASQYTQQLMQYANQLQQYETQLTNLAALPVQTWNGVVGPTNRFLGATSALAGMAAGNGGLDSYLGQFQTINGYQNNSCFGLGGCTAAAQQALSSVQMLGSNGQKSANDAALQGTLLQQQMQQVDAATLETLQGAAASAVGAQQTATAANQIAAFEAAQQLQTNQQLSTLVTDIAMRNEVLADREAQADVMAAAVNDLANIKPFTGKKY